MNEASIETIEEQLGKYVSSEVVKRKVNVAVDAPLVQSGLVDSLGLLQIIVFVERRYGVKLTELGSPADFRSIASLAAAVCRLRAGAPA